MKKINWKKAIIIGLYFGIFQALMPVIGYFLGSAFQSLVTNIDHWIAFVLLALIGVKLGNKFGSKYESRAEIAGGLVLILIGIKILLEHLGI